jgi:hypothetical protein
MSPLVELDRLVPEPVTWLWPGWLAAGKLAVLDGDPGQGKSLVTLDLAARLSRGGARTVDRGSRGRHSLVG